MDDLERIVEMLADDTLGSLREGTAEDLHVYRRAYLEIDADPRSCVYVVEENGCVVGCYQLTIIPNLTLRGTRRAQIEGVRVAQERRGRQLGGLLMRHAIDRARDEGCGLVQLTSNAQRDGALQFYERLGFQPSHVGFKLYLQNS